MVCSHRRYGEPLNAPALLARTYGSWDAFREVAADLAIGRDVERERLLAIGGVGSAVVEALTEAFQNGPGCEAIDRLASLLQVADVEASVTTSTPVSGKTVVFTGSLSRLSRADAKRTAEAAGAKVSGSVSAKTDILVAGPGAGAKEAKAVSLGVMVLDQQAWLALLGLGT